MARKKRSSVRGPGGADTPSMPPAYAAGTPEVVPPAQPEVEPSRTPEPGPPARPEADPPGPTRPEIAPTYDPAPGAPDEMPAPREPEIRPSHDPSPRRPDGPEVTPPAAPDYQPITTPEVTPPMTPGINPSGPPEPTRASHRNPPPRARLSRAPTPTEPIRASNTPPPEPRPSIPPRPPPPRISLEAGTEITGDLLKQLREQRGITLKEIEDVTRVRAASLAAVEAERFEELPQVKIYVKGFVQSLARWIGVDPEQAANSYLTRWERWRERTPAPKRHFIK